MVEGPKSGSIAEGASGSAVSGGVSSGSIFRLTAKN
jgi:hypothetical protein